ncbi:LamG-like jellyroll fold domain-containing protein [Candidatus Poribacteria bacterium]
MRHTQLRFGLVFVCLFVTGLIFSGQVSGKIDPATCVGAWLLDDEGIDVEEDASGNDNNGSVKGNPNWTDGKFGQALDCDGIDDSVDFGDNDNLDMGISNFSVVAWVKVAEYTPTGWRDTVVAKMDTTAPRHGYAIGIRGAEDPTNKEKPILMMGLASASGINCWGTSPINDDAWHHVAMVVDREKSMVFFRDGQFEAETNIAANVAENEDNGVVFGIGNGGGGGHLQGIIDEVAIFKAVLEPEDIDRIMNQGLERVLGITAVSHMNRLTTTWAGIKAQQ